MVLLLDLGEETEEPFERRHFVPTAGVSALTIGRTVQADGDLRLRFRLQVANSSSGIARSLACYPIAIRLALNLDLTTIHELSRTCHSIRDSLLTLRPSMLAHALRCQNDVETAVTSASLPSNDPTPTAPMRATTTPCTRDMVGDCRRCGRVVCRNCTAKQPTSVALRQRYRRLCKTCLKCPLSAHTLNAVHSPSSSSVSVNEKNTGFENGQLDRNLSPPSPTSSPASPTAAAQCRSQSSRSPCTCDRGVWICQPCGQSLRTQDFQYLRVWTWRERYSTYVGGMGTGIGEGVEGEECGRKSSCLAAQEVEKEIECDASLLAADAVESERAAIFGRSWSGTSYNMQEVEGLGGILKKKIRRRERVGKVVKEYEEERRDGKWLMREQTGQNRSWCSWCDRVVPSNKDVGRVHLLGHDQAAAASSSSSLESL